MSLYAVIKDNVVDGIAIADSPMDVGDLWICVDDVNPKPGPRWTYENGVFSPPPPIQIPRIISKASFRFRMTDDEYIGILNAAKSDAQVTAWVETFNMSSAIDLESQKVKDGVAVLVGKNLLTQDRAAQILSLSITSDELS